MPVYGAKETVEIIMKRHNLSGFFSLHAGILSLALGPVAALAADGENLPLWELGIGAAAYHQPHYPGSDVSSTTVIPFPYVIYRGDWLRIDRTVQGIIYESQRLKIDLSAGATSPVESDESDARAGMPDLDPTFEIGPAVSLLLSDPERSDSLWGRIAARAAYSVDTDGWNIDRQGWTFDARLRYQYPLSGQALQLSVETSAAFANEDYLGYFYNVAPQYATPQRPAYRSDAGYAGARLSVGLSGGSGQWRWAVFGAYHNLSGVTFSDSPLVDSKHDFGVGATVTWMFWQSESRARPKHSSSGNAFDTPLLLDF